MIYIIEKKIFILTLFSFRFTIFTKSKNMVLVFLREIINNKILMPMEKLLFLLNAEIQIDKALSL